MSVRLLDAVAALKLFLDKDHAMHAESVALFLLVMMEEGQPISAYGAKIGSRPHRMTRRMQEMSRGQVNTRKAGQKLVYWMLDDVDTRLRRVYLTEGGKKLAEEVREALGIGSQ